MVTLTKSGNAVKFAFDDNPHYLNNGEIEVPVNSLSLVIDDSEMATFRKASSNDIFLSISYDELGMTKAELESFYKENMVGSTGGGGGGITSGEVQSMIDESISGKADTSAVTSVDDALTAHTANTTVHVTAQDKTNWNAKSDFSGSYNDLTDKPTIPTVPTSNTAFTNDAGYITADAISGKADTSAVTESINAAVSGKADTSAVTSVDDALTAHTANTTVHVTAQDKSNWNAKSDFSGDYNDLTNKPTIPTVPTSNTAFTNDAGYITSAQSQSAITAAVSGKVDTSTFNTYSAQTQSALDDKADAADYYDKSYIDENYYDRNDIDDELMGKQDALEAGTGIDITDNVISVTGGGGGGKAIEAGRGITVTTGATADTVSFNLPIWNPSSPHKNISIGSDTNHPNGMTSVAVGQANTTNAQCSFVSGVNNILRNANEAGFGIYNKSVNGSTTADNTLFSVGNGTANNARHNAFEIRQNGDIYITSGGTDIKLQDNLGGGGGSSYTAGDGISITNDVISVSGRVETSAITTSVTSASTDVQIPSAKAVNDKLGGLSLVKLTQAEYDALATKDNNVLYVILPSSQQWISVSAWNNIPSGTVLDLRISSATTIGEGDYLTILKDATEGEENILIGSLCSGKECTEYDCAEYECTEYDEETGECIEQGENCIQEGECINSECTAHTEAWADVYGDGGPDDVDNPTPLTFGSDGYWYLNAATSMSGFESDGGNTAPFDLQVLMIV